MKRVVSRSLLLLGVCGSLVASQPPLTEIHATVAAGNPRRLENGHVAAGNPRRLENGYVAAGNPRRLENGYVQPTHSRAPISVTRPRAKRIKRKKRNNRRGKKKKRHKGRRHGTRAKKAAPKRAVPTRAPSAASQIRVGATTFPLVALEEDAHGNLVRVVCVRETNFGRIVAEAVWQALTDFPPVDMVLINCEEIRANIVGPTITRADIQQALPFNHKLVVMQLTAAQLLAAMEDAVSTKAESPALEHDLQLLGVFVKYAVDRPGLVGREEAFIPSRVKLLQARTGSLPPMVTIVRDFKLVVPANDTFVVATTKILGVDDGGDFKSLLAGELLAETNMTTQKALVRYLSVGTGTLSLIDPPTMASSLKTPTPDSEEGATEMIGTGNSPLDAMQLTDDGEAIHLVCERATNLSQPLFADAIWHALQPTFATDIALVDSDAFRANISAPTHARSLSGRDDQLVVIELTGAQLLATAENAVSGSPKLVPSEHGFSLKNAVSDTPDLASSEHGFTLQVRGVSIKVDLRRKSLGGKTEVLVPSRVISLQVTKTSNADNSLPSVVSVVENSTLVAPPNAIFVVATTYFLGVEGGRNFSSLTAGTLLAHTNVTAPSLVSQLEAYIDLFPDKKEDYIFHQIAGHL